MITPSNTIRMAALLATFVASFATSSAGIVTTTNPGISSDIGARIRWGATGFEASVFDTDNNLAPGNQLNQNPTLNPPGTPVWVLNQGYKFRVTFDNSTGTLGLDVDFNRDNVFATSLTHGAESISQSTFAAPGLTSYVGYGFEYLQVAGNGNVSNLSNLVINGTSFPTITPANVQTDTYFEDSSGLLTQVTITGTLTFTGTGAAQENPAWNFRFISPKQPVPDGGTTIALLGAALTGLAALRRKRA